MTTWKPPQKWHLARKKRFRVTVRTAQTITQRDLGGVTLTPLDGGLVQVESSGEDALDSLSYALNEYLTQPFEVVDEEVL
ncbi:hypothetical protein [Corynebacterium sp. H130]|uniref:hypothetical protein n=1 Tax=Corynebacterium sp. H130 TaxID=3133444 RepID=UPI0030A043E1